MTAEVLLVFGRGVRWTGDAWELTAAGAARVRAAMRYVAANAPHRPRVIFTGGWPEASTGAAPPPPGAREGDLMLRAAIDAGLGAHADLHAETRSRSTLENLLRTVEDQLLEGYAFGAAHPLGLVTHDWHLPRARFLAGKVLGLRGAALLDVPATGGEHHNDRAALLAARLGLIGARRGRVLLRRERMMVALLRRTTAG
ncbi:YdcF family protein [Actinoplanes sp. NPDC026619]|uniref:YdcF family protein n=1 Tax=Actinoplanes sp. NPDC026619 TaxID=3155798 RepID=UPI0033E432F8